MLAEGAPADVTHSGEDKLVNIIIMIIIFVDIIFMTTLPATRDIPLLFTLTF